MYFTYNDIIKMSKSKTLKNQTYGSIISRKLAQHIKEYTNDKDRREVSEEFNKSTSTIRDLLNLTNTLTKKNEVLLVAMLERSIVNCIDRPKKDREALKTLKSMLKK